MNEAFTPELIGLGIAFAGLSLSSLGMVLKLGKLVGRLTQQVETLTKDVNALWKHQKIQDNRCDLRMEVLTKAITVGEETKAKVDLMYQHIIEKGMN